MQYFKLERTFQLYLLKIRNLSPRSVKNYLSDFRQFWKWLLSHSSRLLRDGETTLSKWREQTFQIQSITPQLLSDYKNHLLTSNISKSTTKRKLATIRIFCQFCLNQNWMKKNPALELENPSRLGPKEKEVHDLLSKFGSYLKTENMSKNTIKNYIADARQYLVSGISKNV